MNSYFVNRTKLLVLTILFSSTGVIYFMLLIYFKKHPPFFLIFIPTFFLIISPIYLYKQIIKICAKQVKIIINQSDINILHSNSTELDFIKMNDLISISISFPYSNRFIVDDLTSIVFYSKAGNKNIVMINKSLVTSEFYSGEFILEKIIELINSTNKSRLTEGNPELIWLKKSFICRQEGFIFIIFLSSILTFLLFSGYITNGYVFPSFILSVGSIIILINKRRKEQELFDSFYFKIN